MNQSINRRDFLTLLLATGTAVLAQPTLGSLPHVLPDAGALTAIFRLPESAIAVGNTYLAQHPSSAVQLVTQLADQLVATTPNWYALGQTNIRQLLQEQIKQDFAAEKTVKLQGWLVSLTEARLCALVALTKL
ncbi:MAG: hypothetical protein AAF614_18170 [Chloroflexota bacterium]